MGQGGGRICVASLARGSRDVWGRGVEGFVGLAWLGDRGICGVRGWKDIIISGWFM